MTERPTAEVWEIPRRVWFILASWGVAVLLLAGLGAYWIWSNERAADAEADRIRIEQDKAMCEMLGLFISTDTPPTNDRGRAIQKAMETYRETLRCPLLPSSGKD